MKKFESKTISADKALTLPKVEDIDEIFFYDISKTEWFTRQSLLEMLPKLVATADVYRPKMLFQYGSFVLKDGTRLNWRAENRRSIWLYTNSALRLFELSSAEKNAVEARRRLAAQPDFTAEMSCLKYEKTFGHGYGESFKSAKKGDLYRHETKDYIDYFSPNQPPVRYSLKTKKFEPFAGDAENYLWFESLESSALLARDERLKFEIVGEESVDFEIDGKPEKRELIKIRATGETEVGGDFDKAEAFLYVAPHLRNLVFKTELIFPNAGRTCALRNIYFGDTSNDLFKQFYDYRKQGDKNSPLPKN